MLMMMHCCGSIVAIPLLNIGGFKALLVTISPFIWPIMMFIYDSYDV